MAFASANITLWGHGANFKFIKYESTSDTLATIEAADYFDSYGDQVRVDDVLIAKGTDGTRMYTFTTAASTDVAITPMEGQGALTAHDATTSTAVPAQGIVTFNPTSVLTGTFEITDVPHPGAKLTLVDLNATTSITIAFEGATTSVIEFGQNSNNTLTLQFGGMVKLEALSASIWGLASGAESAASSIADQKQQVLLSN